jgi:hypothetical protein
MSKTETATIGLRHVLTEDIVTRIRLALNNRPTSPVTPPRDDGPSPMNPNPSPI